MYDIWNISYWGNTTRDWLIAAIIMIVSLFAVHLVKAIILGRLRKWSERTSSGMDDLIVDIAQRSMLPLLYLGAVYLSLRTLTISPAVGRVIHVAYLFITTFYVIRIAAAITRQAIYGFIKRKTNSSDKRKEAKGIIIIVNVTIWILGIVSLIDNLGYDVTTIVAGLGIGGIAIALAAQTILGDLFSYFVIFFDRPFEIGDFIVVGDKPGTVEYIGIKTTRLRTLGGEQLICSNTFLTNSQVHNYKRMEERRVLFNIGVTYQTSPLQLQRIPAIVADIITSRKEIRLDRGHFSGLGDFSLNFEFVYYVLDPDYNKYMDIQQDIYLAIVQAFEQEGIEFAYPTQTLFLTREQGNAIGSTQQAQGLS